jgi:hypothetical protein
MDRHPALHVDLMLVEHLQGLLGRGATRRTLLSAQIEPADDDVEQVAIRHVGGSSQGSDTACTPTSCLNFRDGVLREVGVWPSPQSLVCTENLNPDVMMVKPAEDRMRTNDSDLLNRTRSRRILVQRPMRSDGVVVARVRSQQMAKMPLAEHDNVDRDAVSAIRRAVGMRLSGPRIGPSTRCRRRDYQGTPSTLGTAVAFTSSYTLQRWRGKIYRRKIGPRLISLRSSP